MAVENRPSYTESWEGRATLWLLKRLLTPNRRTYGHHVQSLGVDDLYSQILNRSVPQTLRVAVSDRQN